jgi:hypothetical protein
MFQTSLILYMHCTLKKKKKNILYRSGCFERHSDLSRFFSYSHLFISITYKNSSTKILRWPRIELGSTAWKAAMLTIIPPTLLINVYHILKLYSNCRKIDYSKTRNLPFILFLCIRSARYFILSIHQKLSD